jgi:hypothetical protein
VRVEGWNGSQRCLFQGQTGGDRAHSLLGAVRSSGDNAPVHCPGTHLIERSCARGRGRPG